MRDRRPLTHRRPRVLGTLMIAVALAFAGGCASSGGSGTGGEVQVSVNADRLPGTRYAWVPLPKEYTEQNDPRVLDPAFRQRLSDALDRTLSSKGYQRVEDPAQAQWLIAFSVGVTDRERLAGDPSPQAGPTRMNAMQCTRDGCSQLVVHSSTGSAQMDPRRVSYVEGALQIEVLDPASLDVLWRGVNRGTVRRGDARQSRLDGIAARTLAPFPPAPR
ncbi:MAG TPA: DUF4136 domain-containing protein [Stenotrophomonas sp.]|jgi:hypothetical protein